MLDILTESASRLAQIKHEQDALDPIADPEADLVPLQIQELSPEAKVKTQQDNLVQARIKLEFMGYSVGWSLAERWVLGLLCFFARLVSSTHSTG